MFNIWTPSCSIIFSSILRNFRIKSRFNLKGAYSESHNTRWKFSADDCYCLYVPCWEGWRDSSAPKGCYPCFLWDYAQEGSCFCTEDKTKGVLLLMVLLPVRFYDSSYWIVELSRILLLLHICWATLSCCLSFFSLLIYVGVVLISTHFNTGPPLKSISSQVIIFLTTWSNLADMTSLLIFHKFVCLIVMKSHLMIFS